MGLLGVIGLSTYQTIRTKLKRLIEQHRSVGISSFQVVTGNRFTTIEAALIMGRVVTGWSEQDCRDAVQTCFNVWLAEFGTGNKEIEQIKEQAEAFLNVHGFSRFAPLPYDVRDLPIRDLAGYRKKGCNEEDPIIFYTFPSAFEKEIAAGFNYKQFAEVLKTAGMLTPPTSGRGYQRKSPRIDGRQIKEKMAFIEPTLNQQKAVLNRQSGILNQH